MTPNIPNGDYSRLLSIVRPALLAVALIAGGGATGAVVMAQTRATATMAPTTPTAIRALASNGPVTINGRVAEIYGNKFIVADASGRALVETGPRGEGGALVRLGEQVLVQGRFEQGFVHAEFLVGPDKTVISLAPTPGPRGPGPRGPEGHPEPLRAGPDSGANVPAPDQRRDGGQREPGRP